MTAFSIITGAFQSVRSCAIEALCEYCILVMNSFLLIMELYLLAFIKAKLHVKKRIGNYKWYEVKRSFCWILSSFHFELQ
jgi:hypothetical protein